MSSFKNSQSLQSVKKWKIQSLTILRMLKIPEFRIPAGATRMHFYVFCNLEPVAGGTSRVAIVTREDQGRGFRSRWNSRWSFLEISVKFAWARIGMVASVWTRHKQREREERERGRKIRSRVYTGAWKQGECAFNIAEHLQSYLLPLPINTVDGASPHSRALFSATLAASRIIHFWSNCSHLPCRDLVEGTIEDGKGTTRGEAIRERFRDSIVLYLEQSKCLLARDSKKCCVHAEGYKARIFMLCRMTL